MVFTIIVHLTVKSEHVDKVKAKLIEASRTYAKDKGTIDWFVSQGKTACLFFSLEDNRVRPSEIDVKDPTKFAIVERYEQQSDLQTHINNPYYKEFGVYVEPLLSQPLVCYLIVEIILVILLLMIIGTPQRDRIGHIERSRGSPANMVR